MGDQKATTDGFQEAVLQRMSKERPCEIEIVGPNIPTKDMIGKDEWIHVTFRGDPDHLVSTGGIKRRRYGVRGRIYIRVYTSLNGGVQRQNELGDAIRSMFRGRALTGYGMCFKRYQQDPSGMDNDGRYNVLLCTVHFEYREII